MSVKRSVLLLKRLLTYLCELCCLPRARLPHDDDHAVVTDHRQQFLPCGVDRQELTLLLQTLALGEVADSLALVLNVLRELLLRAVVRGAIVQLLRVLWMANTCAQ